MKREDDIILASFDFIVKHSLSIVMIVLSLFMFLIYTVINNIKYEKPHYEVDKIAVVQKTSRIL